MEQVRFDNSFSYDDFGLQLLDYVIQPPSVKILQAEIPGADGVLDYSEWTGYPVYNNREGTYRFDLYAADVGDMERKLSKIYGELNGVVKKVGFHDGYYYRGRISVECARLNPYFCSVTIKGDFDPWKYHDERTERTFSLTGGEEEIILVNDRMPAVPQIRCANEVMIQFENGIYTVNSGKHVIADILLHEGNNTVIVTGTGKLTFDYQEGRF